MKSQGIVLYKDDRITVKAVGGVLEAVEKRSTGGLTSSSVSQSHAEEWSLCPYESGSVLSTGTERFILKKDVTELVQAGITDRRDAWSGLRTVLKGYIGNTKNTLIPYICDSDRYATDDALQIIQGSYSDFIGDGVWPRLPIIQAFVWNAYEHKQYWQCDGSADLAMSVAHSLWLPTGDCKNMDEVFALVQERLGCMNVSTIIIRHPENLGFPDTGFGIDMPYNLTSLVDSLIDKAHSWGCKVIFVGSMAFWWRLQTNMRPAAKHQFQLIKLDVPDALTEEFFNTLSAEARRWQPELELSLTCEVARLILSATKNDRYQALELLRAMVGESDKNEQNLLTGETVQRLTKGLVCIA